DGMSRGQGGQITVVYGQCGSGKDAAAISISSNGLPAVAALADSHIAQEPPGSGTNLCTACEDGSAWIPLRPALAGPLQLAQQVEFPVMLFAQLGLHVPAPVPTRRQLHQARPVPRPPRET